MIIKDIKRRGVKYFNPKLKSKTGYYPTSYLCYSAVRQDLWIAMVGIVGDYSLLHANDLAKEYPGLIRKNLQGPVQLQDRRADAGFLIRIDGRQQRGNAARQDAFKD